MPLVLYWDEPKYKIFYTTALNCTYFGFISLPFNFIKAALLPLKSQ